MNRAPLTTLSLLALSLASCNSPASSAALESMASATNPTPPTTSTSSDQDTYLKDRAQATLYRWFYFYETATPNFEEQFEILDEKIHIEGTTNVDSLAAYKESIKTPAFVFGLNAHHIESVDFVSIAPERTELAVKILYQGITKDGDINAAHIAYKIELVEAGSALPKIKNMTIMPMSAAEKKFVVAYSTNYNLAKAFELKVKQADAKSADSDTSTKQPNENEVKSLVFHWFSLFDHRSPSSEIAPLLADDIKMDFLGKHIASATDFIAWYDTNITNLARADHKVKSVHVKLNDGGADVVTDVDFFSVDSQGKQVDFRVEQSWKIRGIKAPELQVGEYTVRLARVVANQ